MYYSRHLSQTIETVSLTISDLSKSEEKMPTKIDRNSPSFEEFLRLSPSPDLKNGVQVKHEGNDDDLAYALDDFTEGHSAMHSCSSQVSQLEIQLLDMWESTILPSCCQGV